MRHFLFSLLATLALCAPVRADEAAIRGIIASQIEAFQADDFATAFGFASPTIRQIFRTPENFGTMVRQGYPMVWRPADVEFLSTDMIDGQLWQNVMIRNQQGELFILEYEMIPLGDGWKINAVRMREAPGGTV
ncbi:DUF4864 domain-containing protein [Roseovarius aestuarii]|uniref:DUF4864 domain-containing protein n=1 Tax=Roseovarius aestuarii TaxID=475083 RepID=A0A1X7BKZ2_9RHOB|nr:DUF4864 domain-containing protein [Roseovarius aestuarii]SMC10326.1 hypothetical protein ROA7745_00132 [Roseovarius aestuarii]